MIRSISELPAPPAIEVAIRHVPPNSRADTRCTACCHWSVPISLNPRFDALGRPITMEYEGWILWHAHVLQHQRAELLS